MMKDPIVDELHKMRAEQMAEYNFDFKAFYRDLKEQEKHSEQPLQAPPEPPAPARFHRTGGIRH